MKISLYAVMENFHNKHNDKEKVRILFNAMENMYGDHTISQWDAVALAMGYQLIPNSDEYEYKDKI